MLGSASYRLDRRYCDAFSVIGNGLKDFLGERHATLWRLAGQMLAEASYSGFYFDDYGVVTDAATAFEPPDWFGPDVTGVCPRSCWMRTTGEKKRLLSMAYTARPKPAA